HGTPLAIRRARTASRRWARMAVEGIVKSGALALWLGATLTACAPAEDLTTSPDEKATGAVTQTCGSATNCASCTALPTCGWCNGHCYDGTGSGPTGATCGGTSWAWLGSQCASSPATNVCSSAHDCASCTALPTCGWCNGACHVGTSTGPTG